MRDKGFTVSVMPHDVSKSKKEWVLSGRKLVWFRLVAAALFLLLLVSGTIVSMGASEFFRTTELRERNRRLSDSLSVARQLNRRLDAVEAELQQIRETERVIENLATAGVSE